MNLSLESIVVINRVSIDFDFNRVFGVLCYVLFVDEIDLILFSFRYILFAGN